MQRSGLVAKKLGMTRIFTDEGVHVPVTVLALEGCQITAHKTKSATAIRPCSLVPVKQR